MAGQGAPGGLSTEAMDEVRRNREPAPAREGREVYKLLAPDEPPPFFVHRPEGASPFFITCDHAGNLIPKRLGTLGLEPLHLARHIAWDVGASGLCRRLSALLDATVVTQTYSRLVIDCNRSPDRYDSMAPLSEDTEIPGNRSILEPEAEARAREIFLPYHEAISELLDARQAAGRPTVLIAMHSFTPVYHGVSRPWHIGLLYNRDPRLARILEDIMSEDPALCIGDNEPYAISDESDYGIPVHGEKRGFPSIEIEMRHDLIETVEGQARWAERLAEWFARALERL
jgi:predicted N-formylglutamate amidohydrolase